MSLPADRGRSWRGTLADNGKDAMPPIVSTFSPVDATTQSGGHTKTKWPLR
jgi:hypothetical protein